MHRRRKIAVAGATASNDQRILVPGASHTGERRTSATGVWDA
jgi:hypothetical protein